MIEIVAIGTDLLVAGGTAFGTLLFWGALAFSRSMGFLAAFPVNAFLVHLGVIEGMNPTEMGEKSAPASN